MCNEVMRVWFMQGGSVTQTNHILPLSPPQAMLQEKRAESDRVIARLLAESEALKHEAEAARQQAALPAASAREGVQRQEERLLAAEASRDAMQREAAARAGLVRTEGLRQQHLEAELAAVQERLEGVLREGRQQQQEGEGALRTQASAVRVLRESTGLAEARVAELRKMAAEQRSLSGKYDRARLLEGEESELRELDSIRAGLGVTGAGLFPSPGPVPPPPPSYAPRHTVSLTPEGPGQHGSGGSGGSGGARAALSRIAAKIGSGGKERERDREGEREGKGQRLTGKGACFPLTCHPAHTLICHTTPLTLPPIPCKHHHAPPQAPVAARPKRGRPSARPTAAPPAPPAPTPASAAAASVAAARSASPPPPRPRAPLATPSPSPTPSTPTPTPPPCTQAGGTRGVRRRERTRVRTRRMARTERKRRRERRESSTSTSLVRPTPRLPWTTSSTTRCPTDRARGP